ncbi:MAG: transketolase [Bacteroidales bacterium]|jgi:transketolase|nr:transketolase [Bacteroidales bacterium]
MSIKELEATASQVRRDIIRMISHVNSGHPGGSLGCADLMTYLYFEHLNIDPDHFSVEGTDEDMFFLSNGHIAPVWYSVLARTGYFPIDELSTFRNWESRLQGHPTPAEYLPGIRIASGSLGQGLSIAAGVALAKKANLDPNLVYVLTGDGELDEGQNWEAIMFAAAHKVDNLIAIVDYNKKQIDGSTDDVCSLSNLKAKFEAFDWKVMEMNGNDMNDIAKTMKEMQSLTKHQQPIAVLMHTKMGMGVDFMMDKHQWHGTPPNEEQTVKALEQLPETIGDFKFSN